ncbi:MAG: hypothetical protein HOO96_00375 [Polyangiaceae bacterium]|nr:hypothetical protein [Polyangiaceae bacterium]
MTALRHVLARIPRPVLDLLAVAAIFLYVGLALWPATRTLLMPSVRDEMLSDGTDPRALLWSYRIVERVFAEHPAHLFYGAIYTDLGNAPGGTLLWIPWIERILVLVLSPITHDGNIASAMAFALLALNGLAMYWFARVMTWPRAVALAVALAFAVNPFTRARVVVHMGLAGLYYLPLIFAGLEWVARSHSSRSARVDRAWRVVVPATLAFLGAATVAHYYLIIALVSTPLFAVYFLVRCRAHGGPWRRRIVMVLLAAAPTVAWLGFSFARPAPPEVALQTTAYPESTEDVKRQFLRSGGAHFVDYLAGDLKFGGADRIAPRAAVNTYIAEHLDHGNLHERTNGIRWTLLFLAVVAAAVARRERAARDTNARLRGGTVRYFAAFAVVALAFSLAPAGIASYGDEYGPSYWVSWLIPSFRVPCRFGPLVHFGVLCMVAAFVAWVRENPAPSLRRLGGALCVALPLLVVMEYLPKDRLVFSKLRPVIREEAGAPRCGLGMFLPFQQFDYWAYEETRGTSCALMYPITDPGQRRFEAELGPKRDYGRPDEQARVVAFAQCTGLDWIRFRPEIAEPSREQLCATMGGVMEGAWGCRMPAHGPKRSWEACLEGGAAPHP